MKKIFIVFIIFFHSLFAQAMIKKIEVFDRGNSIDVMFFSNMQFTSSPQEFNIQNEKIILLKNATTKQKLQRNFASSVLTSLEIFSKNKDIYIVPKSKIPFEINASKSKDGYTLRLRFLFKKSIDNVNSIIKTPSSIKPDLFKSETSSNSTSLGMQDYQYWLVLGFMVALILIMFFVRKKIRSSTNKTIFEIKNSKLQILATKNIDANNRLLLLGGEKYQYLILLGNKQNILIDKINIDNSSEFIKEMKNASEAKGNKKRMIDDKIWTSLSKK
ncbi:hypothetical protein [Helicobacter cappadocius]|uniref:Flagellar protein n=1 Tax=Helicobacter cappadocius TaxID=3063998 RepID=A0AA90TED4_9HELI|nr:MULTISPECIES: hypothetical protein [unclassified Helicobacter]MDO7252608.1 hypothetical protein [Helicobacter sp. faydin-H75]MDP2538475.1 hypothetical protein [Helicobacter sp. faydin-H76]